MPHKIMYTAGHRAEHSLHSQSQAAIYTINKLHIHGDIDNSPAVRGLLQLYK